jgi:hypothetical protein
MKEFFESWLPISYVIFGLFMGGVGYCACMSGRGWGNFPGNAALAAFGTGSISLIILIILCDAISFRAAVCLATACVVGAGLIHLFGF